MLDKLRRVVRLICYIARTDKSRLALLKSPKVRNHKDVKLLMTLIARFEFGKELMNRSVQLFEHFLEQIFYIQVDENVTLVRKGSTSKYFYILLKGSVMIMDFVPKNSKVRRSMEEQKANYDDPLQFHSQEIKTVHRGSHFGDTSIIDQSEASASCISMRHCQLAVVEGSEFQKIFGKSGILQQKLQLLRQQPFLRGISESDLKNLSYEFKSKTCHNGNFLFMQGQINGAVYIVQEGYVEISMKVDQDQWFGENGVYYETSAKCGSTRCELLWIERNTLKKFFNQHSDCQTVFEDCLSNNLYILESRHKWRLQRQESLQKSSIKIDIPSSFSSPSPLKFQSVSIKGRISNHIDTMNYEQKRQVHKDILIRLNKVPPERTMQFFNICRNFKELRRKESQEQIKFEKSLQNYLSRGSSEGLLDYRLIRTSSCKIPLSPSATMTAPTPKQSRKPSLTGLIIKKYKYD